MDEEPFFPAPRPRLDDATAYRAPCAPTQVYTEAAAPRRVVARPAPESPAPRAETPYRAGDDERFFRRHSLFYRYPRALGGVLLAIGVLGVGSTLNVLLRGGTYMTKLTVLAPVALLVGLYVVVLGAPSDPRDGAWRSGVLIATTGGFVLGIGLLLALVTAR